MKKQKQFRVKEVFSNITRSVVLGIIVAIIAFSLYLLLSQKVKATEVDTNWSEWEDSTVCSSIECDSNSGTKNQERVLTHEVCELSCPVVHFEWTTETCPAGYSPWSGNWCEKNGQQFHLKPKVSENHTADVEYNKSQDPNKCHRPSDNTLATQYGMDHDAKQEFKEENSEWKNAIKSDCHNEVLDTEERTVTCELLEEDVVACEEEVTDVCLNLEGVQEQTPEGFVNEDGTCTLDEEESPESTPSEEPKENTFHEDTRCLATTPPLPTWAYRYWINNEYLANWSAESGSRVDIEVTNGDGEYEYQYYGLSNDGHEILPNVAISQIFRIRTVNGCKKGPWLVDPITNREPFIVK